MSGPKDYTPPPRYSLQVFDGKLNKVFQLQSQINALCTEITSLKVNDTKLQIRFDCDAEMNTLKSDIKNASKSLVLDYKSDFGQETHDIIEKDIQTKIDELLGLINKCNLIKADFYNKEGDYNSYCLHLNFHDNSKVAFDNHKKLLINYFKNEIHKEAPEIYKEAESKISSVNINMKVPDFSFGFKSRSSIEHESLIGNIINKEVEVNSIRNDINNKIINKFIHKIFIINILLDDTNQPNEEINKVIDKINLLILSCEDVFSINNYKASLEKLKESHSLNEVYYYKELHDQILKSEKLRKDKLIINNVLIKLNRLKVHTTLSTEKQNLIDLCMKLFNNSSIRENHIYDISKQYDNLSSNNYILFEEEEIIKKERLFLKSQIVHSLENFGYEVMDDLEVIDFEKGDDFLLKISGQENYLNLKFKADGSFRYVFKIPEDKENLSTDQQDMKLHEMKITCDGFKKVLRDLSKMGLKVNLRSEKKIELKSIVSLSETDKSKTKIRAKSSSQKQQVRKKYLN